MHKKQTQLELRQNISVKQKSLFKLLFERFKSRFFLHLILALLLSVGGSFARTTTENLIPGFVNSRSCCENKHHSHFHDSEDEQVSAQLIPNGRGVQDSDPDRVNNFDYASFFPNLPSFLKKWKPSIGLYSFCVAMVSITALNVAISYYESIVENEISTDSSAYLKNQLIEKFRRTPFEDKSSLTYELKALIENDVETVGSLWDHLINHLCHSFFEVILIITFNWEKITKTSKSFIGFFIFWLVIVNLFYFGRMKEREKIEISYKEQVTKELEIVDREIANASLIESMGKVSAYKQLQLETNQQTVQREKLINKRTYLDYNVTSFLLEILVYSALVGSGFFQINDLKVLIPLWSIFSSVRDILGCFKEYAKYNHSYKLISNFLHLPDFKENREKPSLLNNEIDSIIFSNVDFTYKKNQKNILRNYNHTFKMGTLNNLVGGNGVGKSTILYLALGMLEPSAGEILVRLKNGYLLNLQNDINLNEWKEKIVAYCSHQNLVVEGSTGQKQLANVTSALENKEDAKVFIFDEAGNALDAGKQEWLNKQVEKLVSRGKIVVLVQHQHGIQEDENLTEEELQNE